MASQPSKPPEQGCRDTPSPAYGMVTGPDPTPDAFTATRHVNQPSDRQAQTRPPANPPEAFLTHAPSAGRTPRVRCLRAAHRRARPHRCTGVRALSGRLVGPDAHSARGLGDRGPSRVARPGHVRLRRVPVHRQRSRNLGRRTPAVRRQPGAPVLLRNCDRRPAHRGGDFWPVSPTLLILTVLSWGTSIFSQGHNRRVGS